jgi:alpha-amylase
MDKCSKGTDFNLRVMLAGDYEFTFNPDTPSLKVLRATKKSEFKRQPPEEPCISWDGGGHDITQGRLARRHTVAGCLLGQEAVVKGGKITLTPSKESGGLLLLEPVKPPSLLPSAGIRRASIFC